MKLREKLKLMYRAYKYRFQVECAEISFVLRHVEPGQTCVDIGAHKGAFTYWMQKQVGGTGRVYSFEPQPELAEYLQQAKSAFRMDQVTVIHSAVSNRSGLSQLFRECESTPGATLRDTADDASSEAIVVPLETLDRYFSRHGGGPIDFIKCDVEGHELEVFQGAESILTQDRPKLLFECEQRHMPKRSIFEVFDYLHELGYRGWYFKRRSLHAIDSFRIETNAAPRDFDYIYNFAFLHPARGTIRRAA